MVKSRGHRKRQPWDHSGGRWRVLVSRIESLIPLQPIGSVKSILLSIDTLSVWINRMSFTDWCKLFTDADVCRLINTSLISIHKTWNEVVHFGRWTQNRDPKLNRCGGCANNKPTFLQNPQVLKTLETLCPSISDSPSIHTNTDFSLSLPVLVWYYQGIWWGPDLLAAERHENPQKTRSRRKSNHWLQHRKGNIIITVVKKKKGSANAHYSGKLCFFMCVGIDCVCACRLIVLWLYIYILPPWGEFINVIIILTSKRTSCVIGCALQFWESPSLQSFSNDFSISKCVCSKTHIVFY